MQMKVYPFKIPKPVDEHLIVQIDKEPIFYNRLHQHEEIQISFIKKGSGSLIVGDSINTYNKITRAFFSCKNFLY